MRLEEYDAQQIINYKHNDLDSMRQAMTTFRTSLATGDAFKNDYCVSHFKLEDTTITKAYFDDYPALKTYLKEMAYYYRDSDDYEFYEALTTEELFFLCAVINPELEADIVETCKAMVTYAKELNDSSEMWLTCETAFGIGPLQIVAMHYPEYGYLMAQFLVANWDEEHMPYHLAALYQWARHTGVNANSIKAYCHCDNHMARQQMLGYDIVESLFLNENPEVDKSFDLLTFIRTSKDNYNQFIEILANRFKEHPPIGAMTSLFSEDSSDDAEDLIGTLMAELLIQHHPESVYDYDEHEFETFETMLFIDTPAKDAVGSLIADIEQVLGSEIPTHDASREAYDEEDAIVNDWDDEDEEVEDKLLKLNTLDEKLHCLLCELDEEDYFRSNEYDNLELLYSLINDNRDAAMPILENWLSDTHMETVKEFTNRMKGHVSPATYLLMAVYVVFKDTQKGIFDSITDVSVKCMDKHLSKNLLDLLSEDGEWCSRIEYSLVKDDDESESEYRMNYIKETKEKYEKWRPVENYLKTGAYNNLSDEMAFEAVCHYYKENLKKDDDSIAMHQDKYNIFHSVTHLYRLLYFASLLEGTASYDLSSRALRLMLNCAPVFGVLEIATIKPALTDQENLDRQLQGLQELLPLGLSEEGYWAYQFEFWHDVYGRKDLDETYAMAMIDRLFQGHEMLEKSLHYAPRSKVTELLIKGVDAMEMTDNAQLLFNNFAVDYILRRIKENFYDLTQYIGNLIESNKQSYEKFKIDFGEGSKASQLQELEVYNPTYLEEETLAELSAFYAKEWTLRTTYINKSENGFSNVHNKSILDYCYTCIKNGQEHSVYDIKIISINNWDTSYVDAIQRLSTVDYEQFWLTCFSQFFTGQLQADHIKDLLNEAVKDYDFHGIADYFDVDLDNLLNYVSEPIKEKIEFILETVGAE